MTVSSDKAPSQKPAPVPTAVSQPFWRAAREGRLVLQRCTRCGHLQHYPRPACVRCLGTDMEWIESTGRGSVYSFSVVHRAPSAGFGAPYVVALVDLDEGVRLLTNVVGCEPAEVEIGARVQVCFESRGEEAVPVFQLEW